MKGLGRFQYILVAIMLSLSGVRGSGLSSEDEKVWFPKTSEGFYGLGALLSACGLYGLHQVGNPSVASTPRADLDSFHQMIAEEIGSPRTFEPTKKGARDRFKKFLIKWNPKSILANRNEISDWGNRLNELEDLSHFALLRDAKILARNDISREELQKLISAVPVNTSLLRQGGFHSAIALSGVYSMLFLPVFWIPFQIMSITNGDMSLQAFINSKLFMLLNMDMVWNAAKRLFFRGHQKHLQFYNDVMKLETGEGIHFAWNARSNPSDLLDATSAAQASRILPSIAWRQYHVEAMGFIFGKLISGFFKLLKNPISFKNGHSFIDQVVRKKGEDQYDYYLIWRFRENPISK